MRKKAGRGRSEKIIAIDLITPNFRLKCEQIRLKLEQSHHVGLRGSIFIVQGKYMKEETNGTYSTPQLEYKRVKIRKSSLGRKAIV